MLAAADLLAEAASVVIVGEPEVAAGLLAAALQASDPAVVVLRAADITALPPGHPAFGKTSGPHKAVAYVCRRAVCGLPVADVPALARALRTRD